METVFVEATNTKNGGWNWGKFMVARFSKEEWERTSVVRDEYQQNRTGGDMTGGSLLCHIGWSPSNILVFDLQTGEGAVFRPGGLARADLEKHKIWVCVLFEDFLTWLYQQNLDDLQALPRVVDLDSESALWGYRRTGKEKIKDRKSGSL